MTCPYGGRGRVGAWEPAIGEGLKSGSQGLQAAKNPCLEISTQGPRAGAGSNRGITTFLLYRKRTLENKIRSREGKSSHSPNI